MDIKVGQVYNALWEEEGKEDEWKPARIIRSRGAGVERLWDVEWVEYKEGDWVAIPAEDDPEQTKISCGLRCTELDFLPESTAPSPSSGSSSSAVAAAPAPVEAGEQANQFVLLKSSTVGLQPEDM